MSDIVCDVKPRLRVETTVWLNDDLRSVSLEERLGSPDLYDLQLGMGPVVRLRGAQIRAAAAMLDALEAERARLLAGGGDDR